MRHADTAERRVGFGVLVALILGAAPASAVEFGAEDRVYEEDLTGETAYPTTPEVDTIGAGGLTGVFFGSGDPSLTGGVARVSLTSPGQQEGHQADASGFGTTLSFGVEGLFGNLVVPSDTSIFTSVSAFFDTAAQRTVSASLILPSEDSGQPAYLDLLDFDLDSGYEESLLVLPDLLVAAVRSELSYFLRLYVDRTTWTARASLEVGPFGVYETNPIGLSGLEGVPVLWIGQGAGLPSGGVITSVSVDLEYFAAYSRVLEFAPVYNVDVGAVAGTPSSGYAAAGSAGLWNTIGLGTTALARVDGSAAGATATLTTDSDAGFGPGSPPDAQALMGDFGVDCDADTWSLDFAGLPNGLYRVWIYAPSLAGVSTGGVDLLQWQGLAELPGDPGAALLPGVSYLRTRAVVTSGDIELFGEGGGGFACAGIAGVQLERQVVAAPSVPALSAPLVTVLVGLMLAAGYIARHVSDPKP